MKSVFPNALTLGNLMLGFFSMVLASHPKNAGDFDDFIHLAALFIFLALFLDGLDGPLARRLGVNEGGIGAQLDSLADLTTFGLAPAYLMYQTIFYRLGTANWFNIDLPLGMFLAVVVPMCTAFRLARFNVSHAPDYFQGLPSPITGLVVSLFLLSQDPPYTAIPIWIITPLYVLLGLLMVSTIRYNKPLKDIKHYLAPWRLAGLALFLVGVNITWDFNLGESLLALAGLYIFSGFITLLVIGIKRARM